MSKRSWVGLLLPVAVLGSVLVTPVSLAATAAPSPSLAATSLLGGEVAPASSAGQVCSISGPAGVDWTSRTSPADNDWRSVAWGGPVGAQRFVAVASAGDDSRVMISPDGVNWTTRSAVLDDTYFWYSVTWGDDTFVAVAAQDVATGSRGAVMTSPNGLDWSLSPGVDNVGWFSVTHGDDTFVTVSADVAVNGVMTSSDGVTWTRQTVAIASPWRSVTWGDGTFVAVSNDGVDRVMTSPDGVNWTARTAAAANQWRSVTWGGPPGDEKFVAVASSGSGTRVMTSEDGVTWLTQPSAPDKDWFNVTWGGPAGQELFVAVAGRAVTDTSVVMTSPDGVNWTLRQGAAANQWLGVTWGGPTGQEKFVAVARTGVGNRVMTSSAPITCLPVRVPPGPPRQVAVTATLDGANVTWSPPEDPGTDDVNLYAVRSWPGGPVCQVPGITLSCIVTGLDPKQDYYFTVVAMSSAGWGSASAPSSIIRPLAPEPPGAPTDVVATPGDAQVTVTWTPPSSSGSSPIREYRVTSSPTGGSCMATAPTCTVTGLVNGTAYTFNVEARNDQGWGPASQPSAAVTPRAPSVAISAQRSGRLVELAGVTTGIAPGSVVTVWWRFGGQAAFAPSAAGVRVDQAGSFAWQRRMNPAKAFEAYAVAGDVQSNTVALPGERSR